MACCFKKENLIDSSPIPKNRDQKIVSELEILISKETEERKKSLLEERLARDWVNRDISIIYHKVNKNGTRIDKVKDHLKTQMVWHETDKVLANYDDRARPSKPCLRKEENINHTGTRKNVKNIKIVPRGPIIPGQEHQGKRLTFRRTLISRTVEYLTHDAHNTEKVMKKRKLGTIVDQVKANRSKLLCLQCQYGKDTSDPINWTNYLDDNETQEWKPSNDVLEIDDWFTEHETVDNIIYYEM